MALDLFAGIPVTSYAGALPWYEQFFGSRPSFLPNDTEAVWEVAEHRYVYIVQQPERAGNALVLSFVDDLGDRVTAIARRGIEPTRRETYGNGVTKVTYRDADGNEISLGGPGPRRDLRRERAVAGSSGGSAGLRFRCIRASGGAGDDGTAGPGRGGP
jgi:hypothetical protein